MHNVFEISFRDDRHAHIRAKHEDKHFVRRRPNVLPSQLVQV